MLFKKVGCGSKYLYKIDDVQYLHKLDFKGDYWPYLHDVVAFYHERDGYFTASPDEIVEADENEVVKMFPLADNSVWYKWKE